MIHAFAKTGLVLAAVTLLAACQTETRPVARVEIAPATTTPTVGAPVPTPMDGSWAATDGLFVASFQGGAFTSRFTKTNEILAQGSYRVAGETVTMEWLSVATQEQRSATCRMSSPTTVRCQQGGGGGFDLQRTA